MTQSSVASRILHPLIRARRHARRLMAKSHRQLAARLAAVALAMWSTSLSATESFPATRNATNEPIVLLQSRLAEVKAELGQHLVQEGDPQLIAGATASEMVEYRITLEKLARTFQQHLEELSALEAAQESQRMSVNSSKTWAGFAETPPYSILTADGLRDSIQLLTARMAAGESTRAVLEKLSEESRADLKASDARLRLLVEQLEEYGDRDRPGRILWQRTLEQTRNRLASATVALNDTREQRVDAELTAQREELTLARRQFAAVSQQVRFSQSDLDQVLGRLNDEQHELQREIQKAERNRENLRQNLVDLRKKRDDLLQSPTSAETAPLPQSNPLRELDDRIEKTSFELETATRQVRALSYLLDFVQAKRGLWEVRFATFNSTDLAAIKAAYARLQRTTYLIELVRPLFLRQVDLEVGSVNEFLNRTQRQPTSDEPSSLQSEMLAQYLQREKVARRVLQGSEELARLADRWRESLDDERASLPVGARVQDLFSSFSGFAGKLWRFELFSAEDKITVDGQTITGRRSITVAKVLSALLILAIGYWLTIVASRFVERLAVNRLNVEAKQANLIRRWIRVTLIIALLMVSLVSVKIPLTVFAFLGGALAIGLGFGTQNLLKNFISGIIILFERPFRIGDVLDIDGQRGTVVEIGIRSSVVQSWDGTETLIPNSDLLEKNVTNWTYSNRKVRFAVAVGVAYGSDTRRVAQLLAETAGRHGLVQKDPEPQVLFLEFGDNALNFELRFWVDVARNNAAQVASDLRHMIAGAFTESCINIAFPQRDVHLDSPRPLQVQIIPERPDSLPAR